MKPSPRLRVARLLAPALPGSAGSDSTPPAEALRVGVTAFPITPCGDNGDGDGPVTDWPAEPSIGDAMSAPHRSIVGLSPDQLGYIVDVTYTALSLLKGPEAIAGGGSMQRTSVSGLLAVALLCAIAAPARAHLVPRGADTLLGMLAASDGLLVARSAAATTLRDDGSAATPFLARETISGIGPTGGFVLDQAAPPLRYAEVQDALLLVARRPGEGTALRWYSVQPAGAAILIDGGDVDARTRDVLRRLWVVAHPPAAEPKDGDHGAAALIDALSLSNGKLRALAFLDLSALAASPEHFTKAQSARLATYGDQPGDDAELAPAVRDLGKKLGGVPMKEARPSRDGTRA